MGRILMGVLRRLGAFNAAHPWSHNRAYTPWVLWHARRVKRHGGSTALDVGCGTGRLVKQLAAVLDEVVGVEPDPATAATARRELLTTRNATVVESGFDSHSFDGRTFDLVTFVAVLHHLPLVSTLDAARRLVRPGGRLVIVGVARETKADLGWSMASLLLNPIVGAIRHPRRATTIPEDMTAPTREPEDTYQEIAQAARQVLPGVRMHRGLFWRYTAVWVAPHGTIRRG